MKKTNQIKRILSLLLVFVLAVSCLPVNVFAAESGDATIVIAASDFQNSSGHTKTASLTTNILNQIVKDYSSADGFLFAGDYDYNYNDSANGKAKLQQTVLNIYPDLDTSSMVYVQGNHDSDSLVGSTLSSSGAHDAAEYGVYVINEKDYMWYNDDEATIRRTAASLETYLNAKRNESYSKPIFVVSHLPLHYSMRTLKGGGDGKHANYIFDVLNEAGEAGLNIIFLFGHNHSHGWDDYIGGASIYLEKGDKINIGQNSTSVYKQETLAFTYMNAGYVGYYGNTGNGSDQTLTMTTFAISGDDITIRRYDANGYHTLKAAGVYGGEYPDNKYASPVYAADTSVVSTPHAMILNKEITPAGEDTGDSDVVVEGRTYTRVASASELVSNEKYLLFYSGSYFMLPEVVEKSNSSGTRKGFDLESTSVCGSDTISGDYQDKEWTLVSSGSGWLLSNGSQYAKLTSTSDMSVTATFENTGDVFTVGGSENAYTFSAGSYVLNYNSRGVINGYASNAAAFWIYRMTDEGSSEEEGGQEQAPAGSVRQIMSFDELQENVGYLIVADEGEDITLTNQANGSGLLLSGEVSADNTHLWYLDLTNEYIRYGSPEGTNNYLKVTNGGASVGSSSNRVTEILDNGNGTFSLYRSSYYMNRYGGSSATKAAGYNQNNSGSKWKFYEIVKAHDYETVTVEATCTEAGSVTDTCKICGDTIVEEIAALGHDYEAVTTEATCGKDGSVVHTCARCQDTYTETLEATGNHSYEAVTVEPTCTETGSAKYTCSVCADTYTETLAALGHSYESVTTEATCGKDGMVVHTCSVCANSYTETLAATGSHSYEAVTVAPTCTAGGFTTYTCTVCANSYTADATAALGHSYETAVVDATCTADGSVTHYCEACGDIYSEVLPATGHNYQTAVVEATCTAGGCTTHTCVSCGDSYVTDTTAALGHSYETVTVAPTCLTGGYTSNTCSVCGDNTIYNEIPALGHDYVSVTVDPTETEGGYTTHTCNTCGHTYSDNFVDALGHSIVSVVTEATCETEGYTTHTCTVCGEVTVDSYVPALGHNYETVTVEATCTEAGYTDSTCTTCGKNVYKAQAAYGHAYTSVVTAPTCTNDGFTVHTCGRCGDSYTGDVTAALGHSYKTITVEATCTAGGSVTEICENCGDSYVAETTAALGHSYQTITVEATCTENGSVTEVCGNCGDSSTQVLNATGHSYASAVTAPTCTEGGYTTYTCTACGDSYVGSQTAALGHSYSSTQSGNYLIYTCSGCGDSYSEEVVVNHTYAKVTSISSGNAYVITLNSGNKYYALSHEDNKISLVQITVSSNKITSEITGDLVWNYSSNKLSYEDNGTTYYLYAKSNSSGSWWGNMFSGASLTVSSSSSSSVSFSNSKLKVGSYYLRYSSGNVTLNRSASSTYLFIEQ